MTDAEVLGVAMSYTNNALKGMGALKGASCEIQSIESITGGNRVTFAWEDTEGETHTSTLDVMDGEKGSDGAKGADGADGVGIASVAINSSNHLIITYTNGNTSDAGLLPVGQDGNNIEY